jgi:hypothetical protein
VPVREAKLPPKSKSYEKWVTDVVTRLAAELNLHEWRIGLNFDVEDADGFEDTTAWMNADTRYLSAYIYFTPNARAMWDEDRMIQLKECVVHEVTHILLEPMHKFAKQSASPQTESHLTDLLEQANQRIARIVIEHLPSKFFSR